MADGMNSVEYKNRMLNRDKLRLAVANKMAELNLDAIGAAQCGLAMSACLLDAGREHIVLERGQVAQAWRERSNFIDGAGADAAYVRDQILRREGQN